MLSVSVAWRYFHVAEDLETVEELPQYKRDRLVELFRRFAREDQEVKDAAQWN